MLPTPNHYLRLFNDPKLTPPDQGLSHPTGPRSSRCDCRGVSWSHPTSLNTDWDDSSHCSPHPSTGASTDAPAPGYSSTDVTAGSTPVEADPRRRSRQCRFLGFNQLGEGTASQVNQRLDEVQRDFVRSKEEVGETTKGGSPFAPEILDKPIPSSFRLPALEPYDGSTDPTDHVAVFRAQMALYDTSDALMCHTFPTTLRGPTQMWYSRLKPSFISSFDQFAKEFELNFIASSCPRPMATSLLDLTQGNNEPLAQFVSRFSVEIRRMPDTHPTLAIQAFLMRLQPSRFFWSLIYRPSSMVPEMLQRASQYVAIELLVAGKREDEKKSRGDKP
ncbi:hypothetical protein BHE74_00002909 [Ensete ventricosum]|nr:hypothetical protein BHE74_00002909 [Ensete ventricosum]